MNILDMGDKLKNDKILSWNLDRHTYILKYTSNYLKNDIDVVFKAICINLHLFNSQEILLNNKKIVSLAVKNSVNVYIT